MRVTKELVPWLALNVALLAVVIWQARSLRERTPTGLRAVPPVPSAPMPESDSPPTAVPTAVREFPKRAAATVPPLRPSVDWRHVESADYPTYVKNLRAIGCPEATIRDVVTADVQQAFAARRRDLLAGLVRTNFWEAGPTDAERAATSRKRRALDEEASGVLQQLLGADFVAPPPVVEWKLAEMDLRLGFLPPDKREVTRQLLLHYSDLDEQAKTVADGNARNADESDMRLLLAAYNRKRAELAGLLTPAEQEQVDLTVSWTAENIRRRLAEFHPTEEEFRVIFRAWREHDDQLTYRLGTGQADPGNALVFARIREQLGEQRFAEFRRAW